MREQDVFARSGDEGAAKLLVLGDHQHAARIEIGHRLAVCEAGHPLDCGRPRRARQRRKVEVARADGFTFGGIARLCAVAEDAHDVGATCIRELLAVPCEEVREDLAVAHRRKQSHRRAALIPAAIRRTPSAFSMSSSV